MAAASGIQYFKIELNRFIVIPFINVLFGIWAVVGPKVISYPIFRAIRLHQISKFRKMCRALECISILILPESESFDRFVLMRRKIDPGQILGRNRNQLRIKILAGIADGY